jgi:hypothetical protein
MSDSARHAYNRLALYWFAPVEVNLACDAAHESAFDCNGCDLLGENPV